MALPKPIRVEELKQEQNNFPSHKGLPIPKTGNKGLPIGKPEQNKIVLPKNPIKNNNSTPDNFTPLQPLFPAKRCETYQELLDTRIVVDKNRKSSLQLYPEHGWIPHILSLDELISSYDPEYEVIKIRKKFDALRYDLDYSQFTDYAMYRTIATIVMKAEAESFNWKE